MNIQTSRNGLYFVDRDVLSSHRKGFVDLIFLMTIADTSVILQSY